MSAIVHEKPLPKIERRDTLHSDKGLREGFAELDQEVRLIAYGCIA